MKSTEICLCLLIFSVGFLNNPVSAGASSRLASQMLIEARYAGNGGPWTGGPAKAIGDAVGGAIAKVYHYVGNGFKNPAPKPPSRNFHDMPAC